LALLLVNIGKEQRQQERSCQENGRRHIDMNEQVTAPTSKATYFENSRELQGVRWRIQVSFVAVNAYDTNAKRVKNRSGSLYPGGLRLIRIWGLAADESRVPTGYVRTRSRAALMQALDFAHLFR
jgi:hypothetical protein